MKLSVSCAEKKYFVHKSLDKYMYWILPVIRDISSSTNPTALALSWTESITLLCFCYLNIDNLSICEKKFEKSIKGNAQVDFLLNRPARAVRHNGKSGRSNTNTK